MTYKHGLTLGDLVQWEGVRAALEEADATARVVAAVRHALEHSRYAVNEEIIQAMREGGFWVGEQRQ